MSPPSLELNPSILTTLQLRTPSGSSQDKSETGTLQQELGLCYKPLAVPKSYKAEIILKELSSYAAYDVNNGGFLITRFKGRHARKPGEYAGSLSQRGYIVHSIFSVFYPIHRLVWLWFNGDFPKYTIDHINGVRTDNRIENLREIAKGKQARNMAIHSNNTSGYTGVVLRSDRIGMTEPWEARITIDYKRKFLGFYASALIAHRARESFIEANPQLGFTERHGK